MISPHHSHHTNGVGPLNSLAELAKTLLRIKVDEMGKGGLQNRRS